MEVSVAAGLVGKVAGECFRGDGRTCFSPRPGSQSVAWVGERVDHFS